MNIVKEEKWPTTDEKGGKEFSIGKMYLDEEVQDADNTGMQSACDDVDDDIKLFLGWFHCA